MTTSKKRGRPPLPAGEGKDGRMCMRVSAAERAAWQDKADAAGVSLSKWMQDTCNRMAIKLDTPEALTGGDWRSHIICVCPDCVRPTVELT